MVCAEHGELTHLSGAEAEGSSEPHSADPTLRAAATVEDEHEHCAVPALGSSPALAPGDAATLPDARSERAPARSRLDARRVESRDFGRRSQARASSLKGPLRARAACSISSAGAAPRVRQGEPRSARVSILWIRSRPRRSTGAQVLLDPICVSFEALAPCQRRGHCPVLRRALRARGSSRDRTRGIARGPQPRRNPGCAPRGPGRGELSGVALELFRSRRPEPEPGPGRGRRLRARSVLDPEHHQTGGHDPSENGFNLQALELSLGSSVDPYFRFDAQLVFAEEGVELEEAYATTLDLGSRLQARAGQFLTRFGRLNATHLHTWNFVDQPFALGRAFGADGNRGLGFELSYLTPPALVRRAGRFGHPGRRRRHCTASPAKTASKSRAPKTCCT